MFPIRTFYNKANLSLQFGISIVNKDILNRDLVLFVFMVITVNLFWKNNLFVGSILLLETITALIFFYKNSERIFFVFTGLFGTTLEIIGGIIGIWKYSYPDLIAVPFWIFFCWGFTFMLLNSLYSVIQKHFRK